MSYQTLHHRSVRLAAKERAPRQELPKCDYCGRTVPAKRRATSSMCSVKCEKRQYRDDEESARTERQIQESGQDVDS